MRFPALVALAALTVATLVGCAGAPDDGVEDDAQSDEEELSTVAHGVDTNNSTLDIDYARSRGVRFVCRYLSFDGEHPALTRDEAARFRSAGMPLVSIWETGAERAIQAGSIHDEYGLGVQDARAAKSKMAEVGAPANKPIYFTVDFNLTPEMWQTKIRDKRTHQPIEMGELVLAYFNGVNSVLGRHRTGVYGTYTAVNELFNRGKVAYGWQMTFGGKGKKVDSRAALRQYNIYPDQSGWGVGGAGALDLDRAVKHDFGQW